ncbi:hypothetical protein EV666_102184 [Camelimonas lactis]|uniref:GcrA cell cycle regulator n=1 Tax=Camelimonas lactis TaxID=659006 RepID=A0A4R2GWI8_9HYPH|nr:hypothetical protein EV666_102184 [Camelimonas lactis]
MSIPLLAARRSHCRWFVPTPEPVRSGREKHRPDAFGDRHVCGATVKPGSSYCPEHCLRVYDTRASGDRKS